MTVKVSKPAINVREELADLRKPTGIAGEAMLRAETPQEQFNLIGAGRRNWLINGGFDVWQRGTSFVNPGNGSYNSDRFLNGSMTSQYTVTKSSATVNGKQVSTHRTDVTGNGSIWLDSCYQVIEDYKILDGQWVTMSAWVKTNIPNITFRQWSTANHSDDFTADGNWNYVTTTFLANTSAGAVNGTTFGIVMSGLGAVSSGDYLEIAMFQLELGKVATPFEHRSYGEELALCQRYYCNWTVPTQWTGYQNAATAVDFNIYTPVPMRSDSPSISNTGSFYKWAHDTYQIQGSPTISIAGPGGSYFNNNTIFCTVVGFTGGANGHVANVYIQTLEIDDEL
jgi:hypothetical protein